MKRILQHKYFQLAAIFLSLTLVCVVNGCRTLEKSEVRSQKTEVQVDTLWLEPVEPTEILSDSSLTVPDSLSYVIDSLTVPIDTLLKTADTVNPLPSDTVVRKPRVLPPPKKDNAFEVKIERTAVDSVVQDVKEKLIHYYGNAVVKYDDIVLEANYLKFDLNTNVVTAKGLADTTGPCEICSKMSSVIL